MRVKKGALGRGPRAVAVSPAAGDTASGAGAGVGG